MLRNGELRDIKIEIDKTAKFLIGNARDDAHHYRIMYYYDSDTMFYDKVLYITITFNKYRENKEIRTRKWRRIKDVYGNRQGLLKELLNEMEEVYNKGE